MIYIQLLALSGAVGQKIPGWDRLSSWFSARVTNEPINWDCSEHRALSSQKDFFSISQVALH